MLFASMYYLWVFLPIGISFFKFQAMSYVFDVYSGKAKVQKSIAKFALYVSFFPQLIAGLIAKYGDVEEQIDNRRVFKHYNGGLIMKILVIGREGRLKLYAPDWEELEKYDISYVPADASDEEIIAAGKGADYILADAMARVSRRVIASLPKLKMIHSEGVGYNYFDIEAAREKKVYVCNCKAANARAVAEQSILLMLGLLRDVVRGDRAFREGRQLKEKEAHMLAGDLLELGECTVGLLGFGDIAQEAAGLLRAFGARVIYHNRTRKTELEGALNVTYVSKEELLEQSDIISVYLNSNADTFHIVDDRFLLGMKKGAYLVNTARGDLVDSDALIEAIASGHLAGAGLDTVADEPVKKDNALLMAPDSVKEKLLFSPHIGGITGGAFKRCHEMFWSDLKRVENGGEPEHIVNPW